MAKNIVLKITQKGASKTAGALKSLTSSAASLGAKVGLVSAGFGTLSVKLAGDFQKSLLEVSTLMQNTNEHTLPKMSRELRSLAGSSGVALSSLSKAKYDIVSSGFSNAAESALILNASAKLAVGGVTNAASAADLLTTSLNAFGLESSDVDRISDSLFTTVRLGKTTMDELGASLGAVLPFAKSMNLSFNDVGASMATLTSSGIKTAEATTALRAVITSLSAPSEGAKNAMSEAGIEVRKFDDGTVDLSETIKQFKGLDADTIKRFIPNVSAVLGIQTMSNNFNVLNKNIKEFSKIDGATITAFEKMSGAFNTQFAKLKNNVQSIMIEVGNIIIEVIQPKIESLNDQFSMLGDIGWDVIGETLNNNVGLIFNLLKMTINTAFEEIESRAELMGLKIKNAFQEIIPLAGDSVDEINALSAKIAEDSAINAEKLRASFAFVYQNLVDEAQQSADARNEIEKVATEKMQEELAIRTNNSVEAEVEKVTAIHPVIDMEQFRRTQLSLSVEEDAKKYKLAGVNQMEIDKIKTKSFLQLQAQERSSRVQGTGEMLGLLKQAASGNKQFGLVTKRLAQGEAIVSTYQAATKAFANFGGFPAGVIPAAASIAIGMANVSEIEKTQFADGGIVPGVGNQDTVPAMLTPGEVILNQAQQENLTGSMGGVTVNIGGNIIGNEEFVRDTLIPEIQKGINLA